MYALSRLMSMGITKARHARRCSELRSAYNDAFAGWAKELTVLQTRAADPAAASRLVEEATEQAHRAETAYRESRNRLCECMKDSCG